MVSPLLRISFGKEKVKESPQNTRYLVRIEEQVRRYGMKDRGQWGVEKIRLY